MCHSLRFQRNKIVLTLLFLLLTCFCAVARLGASESEADFFLPSEDEFTKLALHLAPRVSVFAAIWKEDPKAIFYGGTSRDFLYWILGKLHGAKSKNELQAKVEKLKKIKVIDIRKIVGIESDVDVISSTELNVVAESYGVRKIDRIDSKRLDPNTDLGQNEINQGYIAVEKIRIARDSISTPQVFGNGVRDLLTGQLSIHFSEPQVFWKSYYAKTRSNHPVLLAVRYLRLLAAHWYHLNGNGYPDRDRLLAIDPVIKSKIKQIFKEAISDRAFCDLLNNEKGLSWLNGSIIKAFRSYTNPTAAYVLFSELGFKDLQSLHPKIASINQFLFRQYRDEKEILESFNRHKKRADDVYQPAHLALPSLKLFHGTKTEEAFRAIIFQHIMPSEFGSAGSGLYAVDENNIEFAEKWGGDIKRIVSLEISPEAKVVDITSGVGAELFQSYSRAASTKNDFDGFSKTFGIDILIYPYETKAYVVKNSSVILSRQGFKRRLMTLEELSTEAEKINTEKDFKEFLKIVDFNGLAKNELDYVLSHASTTRLAKIAHFVAHHANDFDRNVTDVLLDYADSKEDYVLTVVSTRAPIFKQPPSIHDVMRHSVYTSGDLLERTVLRFIDNPKEEIKLGELIVVLYFFYKNPKATKFQKKIFDCLIKRKDQFLPHFGYFLDNVVWNSKITARFLETISKDKEFARPLLRYLESKRLRYTKNDDVPFDDQKLYLGNEFTDGYDVYGDYLKALKAFSKDRQFAFELLESKILLTARKKLFDYQPDSTPWRFQKAYTQLVNSLLRLPNPPPELLLHIFLSVVRDKTEYRDRRVEIWVQELIQNKTLSIEMKKNILPWVIEKLTLTSNEARDFVLEAISGFDRDRVYGENDYMLEYLNKYFSGDQLVQSTLIKLLKRRPKLRAQILKFFASSKIKGHGFFSELPYRKLSISEKMSLISFYEQNDLEDLSRQNELLLLAESLNPNFHAPETLEEKSIDHLSLISRTLKLIAQTNFDPSFSPRLKNLLIKSPLFHEFIARLDPRYSKKFEMKNPDPLPLSSSASIPQCRTILFLMHVSKKAPRYK